MVKTSMEFGARVIVAGMRMPPNYGPQYTEEFHALYERVSSSTGAAYIPFLLEGIADQRELMQSDGIHPSVDAQTLIVDIAWPALKSAIEDILISQRRHPRGGSLDDQPDPPA